jgi:tripeptide aminopeptidase
MEPYLENLPEYVKTIRGMKENIIANVVLIGQVPAPTFKEKRRSTVFLERLAESQVDECTTDGYRNPIGIIRGTSPEKPPIFVVAHIDTFFDKDIEINYTVKQDWISGPGILDNSLGVGVLASLPDIFNRLELRFASDIVLAGTIQSTGKGNLRGIRHLVKTWSTPIRGAVCIEGGEFGRLNYFSDGMIRAEIDCNIPKTTGVVHRYRPNAILVLNQIINEILKLRLPQRPRSRIVIGKITGGVDHGSTAYGANMGLEIRSHSDVMVKTIYRDIQDIVSGVEHENEVNLGLKKVSNLSAARLKFNHPLVKAATDILKRLEANIVSEPTESALSIFLSKNIPGLTVGITHGENYLQENARIEIEPMFSGIAQIVGIIQAIDSGVCDDAVMA